MNGILPQHNLALRNLRLHRALVTEEFKKFVELLASSESLTIR